MYRIDEKTKQSLIQAAIETGNGDAIKIIEEADDPVLWAESHLKHPDTGESNFKVKRAFYELLRSPCKDRAVRVGRQSGKTVHLCVDILHTLCFKKNVVAMVFVTSIPLMNRMLKIISNLVRGTDIAMMLSMRQHNRNKDSVNIPYDHSLFVSNGNVVYFFAMNKDPDKARGQYATHVYVDEADYMPDKAWPVITGILKGNPSIRLWASSTPSGETGSWFEKFCKKCRAEYTKDAAEFHIPSTLDENWDALEPRLRAVIHDEVTWKLEVLAEFVEPKGAVYKKEVIDAAFERWGMDGIFPSVESVRETSEYRNAQKFLGVDWNTPQNGVRIVEVAYMWNKLLLTRNDKIAYEEYTQLSAVKHIINLIEENKYAVVSVDAGYGATQIEMLKLELSTKGFDPERLINVVDSNLYDTITLDYQTESGEVQHREYMKVRVKYRIVGLLGQYLETILALPPEEEQKIGLEIRNFRRKSLSRDGGFIYSDDSHSLSALQVCIHGYDKFVREVGLVRDNLIRSEVASTPIFSSFSERSNDPIDKPFYYKNFTSEVIANNRNLFHRTRGLHGQRRSRTFI